MMPESFGPRSAPDLWVAVNRQTELMVGAAAVSWRLLTSEPGFPVNIHVLPPQRRRGIGSALVEAVASACAGATPCIHGWTAYSGASDAAAFLRAVGFAPRRQLLEFEAEGERFYAVIAATLKRLRHARKIPASFRIVSLKDARTEEVAALVSDNFHEALAETITRIARGLIGYDERNSVVLLNGDAVGGALLYRWNDGIPLIDVNVVKPELRHGAANVMILEAATRNGLAAGATRFRFSCEETVRDTMNIAKRCGAVRIDAKVAFTRFLTNSWDSRALCGFPAPPQQ